MSDSPRFVVHEAGSAGPGAVGFWGATFRRLTLRTVALSLGLMAVLALAPLMDVRPTNPAYRVTPEFWWSSALITVCGVCSLVLGVIAADEAVVRGMRRLRAYALGVVLAAALGAFVQYPLRLLLGLKVLTSSAEPLVRITQPVYVFVDLLLYGGAAVFIYVNVRTARLAADRRREAELARAQARRRTLESQLQAMQARVEPQFLFNTLAQVRQMYEGDPVPAGRMLDDLIAYLRAALPHLRESSSTLGKEAELARAYLNIMQVRLGNRLSFHIEVDPALADARLPPMMLLPLIDHALVYGLAPSQAGGSISVTTSLQQGRLRLAITDSGAGFVPGGNDRNMHDINERLHALFGDDAQLRLQRLQERGTQAVLEIPYEDTHGSHR